MLLFLFFSTVSHSLAETPPPGSVTLSELLDLALSNNQQIISAKATAQRYNMRVQLIDLLTEPIMSYYYLGYPIANMSGGSANRERRQGAPKTPIRSNRRGSRGKILTGRDMIENQALWFESIAEDLQLQIARQVRETFYKIYFLDRTIEVTEQSMATLEDLTRAGDAQYAVGNIRQKDLLKLQSQRYRLSARLIELQQQRHQIAANLNYLTARPPSIKLIPRIKGGLEVEDLVELKVPVNTLISGLYQNRPLIKGYQSLGGRFVVMRNMAQKYFNRDVQEEARSEADGALRAVKAEGADFFNKTMADIQISTGNLSSYLELAKLYGRVLVPQARQIYQTSLADFQVGQGEYLETLQSLLDLDAYQVKYYQALSDYQVEMARLEGFSGRELN